jgi:hypothetical protein
MSVDYDKLVHEYETSLVTKLRGHGAGSLFDLWVPDSDPARGILNMVEAAWAAGQQELEIHVSAATLDEAGLARMRALVTEIGSVSIIRDGDRYVIGASGSSSGPRPRGHSKEPSVHHAAQARHSTPASTAGRDILWEVHPELEPVLVAETSVFKKEGSLEASRDGILARAQSNEGSLAFEALRDTGAIISARHAGAVHPMVRRILELVCRQIEGRTVQDAADHGVIQAIHCLRGGVRSRPVDGVLLPRNAGTAFVRASRLVREACRLFQEQAGTLGHENFFEAPPQEGWTSVNAEERLQRVVSATAIFCKSEGIEPNTLKPVRVEKDIAGRDTRIIIQMSDRIPADRGPEMLRRFERELKASMDPVLQVYLEPWKDLNVLRRL